MSFRQPFQPPPKTPYEGLMRLAAAVGRYEALREIRETNAAPQVDSDDPKRLKREE